ncbi:MAG: C1 family peptidase [Gammaproteobacteria bacterium]
MTKLGNFSLTARADAPDFRDYVYEPPLSRLKPTMARPGRLNIRNQGDSAACTGFALAGVIDVLIRQAGRRTKVSARMLYEMARRYDEWRGHHYEGSSCRGAIKGWYNMGVCRESLYPFDGAKTPEFTIKAAKDARRTTVGAYYRLGERLSDYHAALNETGSIYCSANVHDGWERPDTQTGRIPLHKNAAGGHAFAIVGYDRDGFWIQNSWGREWGRGGTALWTYEDWLANIQDAWVFRLAVPTPQIWHLPVSGGSDAAMPARAQKPTRAEIAGHFLHVDDGQFRDGGRYWSDPNDVRATAKLVAESDKYDHLLFYAHGGLNSANASARRIAAMKETFKANRIYPYHVMYDTGLLEELKDVLIGRRKQMEERAGGIADWLDALVEKVTRVPGRALWREMKAGARLPFEVGNAGCQTLTEFTDAIAASGKPKKIHLAGHSTGMILLAYLVNRFSELAPGSQIDTVSLMAPAGSLDLFTRHLQPALKAGPGDFRIRDLTIYNLTDKLERDDKVTGAYNKSLLYLVSNAFEETPPEKILGMQRYSKSLMRRRLPRLHIEYSEGPMPGSRKTESSTHGGFDNDPATMNHILRRVVRGKPTKPFTDKSLEY